MKKEIVYSIHAADSKSLTLFIDEVELEEGAVLWPNVRKKIYQGVLPALMDEKQRALRALGRRESPDTIDYSEIVIESKRANALLKEIAATGKLYYNKKNLIPNFFKGSDVRYVLNGEAVSAHILSQRGEIKLAECSLLLPGTPPLFIYKGFLEIFHEELSWKWLRKAYSQETVTPKELEELIELEGSRVKIQSEPPKPVKFPVLYLTDHSGAFANLEGEEWKGDLLEAGYQEKKVGSSSYYCPLDKASDALTLLLEIGWDVKDHLGNKVLCHTGLEANAHLEGEGFIINGKVKFGEQEVSLAKVALAKSRKEHWIQLAPGFTGFIGKGFFPEGEIQGERIKRPKNDISSILEMQEHGIKLDETVRAYVEKPKLLEAGALFKGVLRPYQKEGLSWLSHLHRCGLHGILADDMGLGKTVQTIAFLTTLQINHPILIVAPRSLLFNWKQELKTFLPDYPVYLHHGADRSMAEWSSYKIILTSYSIVRGEIESFKEKSFSCIFLDEAQAIKNGESQTAQAIYALKGEFRLSITGTPIENHLGELASQFHFLMPGLLKSEAIHHPGLIKKKTRPFILRRRKHEVDEQLPEKIEQTVWLNMEPAQRLVYDSFLNDMKEGVIKKAFQEGAGKHRMEILEAILRLRQICCHPWLNSHSSDASVKYDVLFNDLEVILDEGQKALVFSQFTGMLSLIKKQCSQKGWKFSYLDGQTKDREKEVKQFQEDPEIQLFLISLKAGGVGLNLTAADYVFLYDPWWNTAVENQAIDRAHRIGRRHPVIAKRFIIKDTIEEKMMNLKASKQQLSDDIFSDSPQLSTSDLEYLLNF